MRYSFLLSIILLIGINNFTFSQQKVRKLRIDFNDKNNSPFILNKPEDFLSEKAIERRERYNIPIVENDIPVNQNYINEVLKTGAVIINKSKWFNFATVYYPNDTIPDTLNNIPFIKNITKTGYYFIRKNKPLSPLISENYKDQSKLESQDFECIRTQTTESQLVSWNYDYGFAKNQIQMINGHFLHKNGYAGDGMTIAVLDGGFYHVNSLTTFDSLWYNNQIIGARDFVDPYGDVYAQSNHGMKVLSTMAANTPGEIVGTAPRANYWLIRTEDATSEYITEEDSWIAGAEFADSVGADIINSSLGYTDFDESWMNHTYNDMDGNTTRVTNAADLAASKGIVVVNSAGNSGDDPWLHIGAPADGDSVFTIGAVKDNGGYASFSSIGPTADGRMKPDVTAQGQMVAMASTIEGVTYGNGTSFSAPIIAGLTACLWQAVPEMNNIQLIELLKSTSSYSEEPNYKYGFGIPDFAKAFTEATHYNIPNFDKEKIVKVSPNPFYDELKIKFFSDNTSTIDIQIVDVSGRTVYEAINMLKFEGYNSIDIKSGAILSQGVYILKIKSNGTIHTNKIVKGR